MENGVLEDLSQAVGATAATFSGRGSEIKERELEMALETSLRTLGHEPHRQMRVHLKEAWNGRVGGVDLGLALEDNATLIELKWDPATLAACAWDSVKLAAALQAEEGHQAFLVAGSPISEDLRGDELLTNGEIEPVELRSRYAKEFDFWKTDVKNHPLRVPSKWRIRLVHTAQLEFKGAPWQIRLAELTLTDSRLTAFE